MPFTPPSNELIGAAFPALLALDTPRHGGFKAVYRAHTARGAEAFKLLCLPAAGTDEQHLGLRREHLGRAQREVALLADVDTPEVVKLASIPAQIVMIAGEEYLGYSEEWLDGPNLMELSFGPRPAPLPSEAECRTLLFSLFRAIRAIWGLGVVHRDIKPCNVIKLADRNRPFVLLDLGIAYDVNDASLTYEASQRLPPATYRYFAPEMARLDFRDRLDYRADLYTAGLTVFEYAAQQHPIARRRDDLVQTISRAVREPPRPLRSVRADFSDGFCTLVDQLLKKQPMLRGNLPQLIQRLESMT